MGFPNMPNREEREHFTGKASPIESGDQQFYFPPFLIYCILMFPVLFKQ